MTTGYVTDFGGVLGYDPLSDPTPIGDGMEEAERYRIYNLCHCDSCNGTGKIDGKRDPACRGEGRILNLVATCGTPEAVGVAFVTLANEHEFDQCPVGLLDRPQGQTGRWLIKPWLPWQASMQSVSAAARTMAQVRHHKEES